MAKNADSPYEFLMGKEEHHGTQGEACEMLISFWAFFALKTTDLSQKFSLPLSLTLPSSPQNLGMMGNMLEQFPISVGALTPTTFPCTCGQPVHGIDCIVSLGQGRNETHRPGLYYELENPTVVILMGLSL